VDVREQVLLHIKVLIHIDIQILKSISGFYLYIFFLLSLFSYIVSNKTKRKI